MKRKLPHFAVSLMCMDLAHPADQIYQLNKHAYSFHYDLMDGHFAPNLALSPDWIRAITPYSKVRNDIHLMSDEPERWLEPLAQAGADIISPHAETIGNNAFRIMNQIKELGCKTGLVINPMTPFDQVKLLLDRVDLLTFMTVDTGFAGQPFINEVLGKIHQAYDFRNKEGLQYEIQIDGHCCPSTFARIANSGADTLILGNAGLFSLDHDLDRAWQLMEESYQAAVESAESAGINE
ncbi:ribulose-phosphate 3-epimerase [Bifidobacterium sp. B4107]|uniref:D-allulose 6-phosphate 3-epimerase n=1 Tax=unclassified Bifidobacterium TaxID=2608897 RepID=UPI00226B8343|nr:MULTISPECIES: D-allulose 6-phosphate 3-epimerase [unclassified Bifidobacterium]MCX8647791.1 ribulose-phosphate 3-epimerase [Bifidobacterium sp. B4107]MCX8651971.1 ribulose-phosphate 3-epimerase [Bifidobacterium sp. B4111]MCX8658393.1 ribulose-phosphate 3-epimerase [Bifidobacterium sp. B4114]